jgi:hypothetical protein
MRKTHDKTQADLLVKSQAGVPPAEPRPRNESGNASSIRGDLLKPPEAAAFLGLGAQTINNWRCRGIGPPYCKMPGLRGSVRYCRKDLEQFLAQHRHVPSVSSNIAKIRGF